MLQWNVEHDVLDVPPASSAVGGVARISKAADGGGAPPSVDVGGTLDAFSLLC